MLLSNAVVAASFLIAVINTIWAMPEPGIVRERHVIHAPIKIKYIHHYKVKKVPIVIKKHLHYYKQEEETHNHGNSEHENTNHESQPFFFEHNNNQIYSQDHEDEDDSNNQQHQFPPYDNQGKFGDFHGFSQQTQHDFQEDDYEEDEQSKEEDYEDYEYK